MKATKYEYVNGPFYAQVQRQQGDKGWTGSAAVDCKRNYKSEDEARKDIAAHLRKLADILESDRDSFDDVANIDA